MQLFEKDLRIFTMYLKQSHMKNTHTREEAKKMILTSAIAVTQSTKLDVVGALLAFKRRTRKPTMISLINEVIAEKK